MDRDTKVKVSASAALTFGAVVAFLVGIPGMVGDAAEWAEWVAKARAAIPWGWAMLLGGGMTVGALLPWAPELRRNFAAKGSRRRIEQTGQTVAAEPEPKGESDRDQQSVDFDGFEGKTVRELYDAFKLERGLRHGLEGTVAGLRTENDRLAKRVNQMTTDAKNKDGRIEKLRQHWEEEKEKNNPPPPESDLSETERAIAFTELGKVRKKTKAVHNATVTLLEVLGTGFYRDRPANDSSVKMRVDLCRCMTREVVSPLIRAFKKFDDSTRGESAEAAQDALLDYLRLYNTDGHYWITSGAEYADVTLSDLPEYVEWHPLHTALWNCVNEYDGDTGSLRRMAKVLEHTNESALIPKDVPSLDSNSSEAVTALPESLGAFLAEGREIATEARNPERDAYTVQDRFRSWVDAVDTYLEKHCPDHADYFGGAMDPPMTTLLTHQRLAKKIEQRLDKLESIFEEVTP